METIIFLAGIVIGIFLGYKSTIKLWNLKVREIFRIQKRLKKDKKEYEKLVEELKMIVEEADVFKDVRNRI